MDTFFIQKNRFLKDSPRHYKNWIPKRTPQLKKPFSTNKACCLNVVEMFKKDFIDQNKS